MIETITDQIKVITSQINDLIETNKDLRLKKEVLKTICGIGEVSANQLIVLLPELGKLNRREIACLSGLTPRANDSGIYKGYRSTMKGRANIKPILFMCAMTARRSQSKLRSFYEKLVSQGKTKMLALSALMRKLIVIANAKIRDLLKESEAIKI